MRVGITAGLLLATLLVPRTGASQTSTSSVTVPGGARFAPSAPEDPGWDTGAPADGPGAPRTRGATGAPAADEAQPEDAPPAPDGTGPPPPPEDRPPRYQNPRGSFQASGILGLATGQSTSFVVGAGLGYAVLTGVLPGVKGFAFLGGVSGGELAATLTLTPPIEFFFTPFAYGEAGRRWQGDLSGWIYGVGGGAYLGKASGRFNVQLGYVWRRFVVSGFEPLDVSTPIVSVTLRF